MKKILIGFAFFVSFVLYSGETKTDMPLNILAFSKTTEYRHDSIPNAIKALAELSEQQGWKITFTEDAEFFNESVLSRMDIVIFLLNTGDVLEGAQRDALQAFIRSGGGFVGVHCATVTEPGWPWYQEMMVAQFTGHPPVCDGKLIIEDPDHPATQPFCEREVLWNDEFYSFDQNPQDKVHVLISVDESSYDITNNPWFEGVDLEMGDHPLVWCREFEGGRVIQTSLGHAIEKYDDPVFRQHLVGAIKWAANID